MARSNAADFSYSHEDRIFTVGTRKVSSDEAKENYRTLYPQENDAPASAKTALANTLVSFVMYPRMYDWLHNNLDTALMDETTEVMIDAFADIRKDTDRKHLQPDTGLFGFSMNRIRGEHPHIVLSVLGRCACMGVSVNGMIGQSEWDTKFAAFDMHNIDTIEQRLSVLAGLGHLAFRARRVE